MEKHLVHKIHEIKHFKPFFLTFFFFFFLQVKNDSHLFNQEVNANVITAKTLKLEILDKFISQRKKERKKNQLAFSSVVFHPQK